MGTYDDWVGCEERRTDVASAAPAHLLAATLDREQLDYATGDPLPPVWHWLYFLSAVRTREVGADGHPPRGGFLPPVPLPRRMRAGGQFRIERPIRIGDVLERRSKILGVSEKSGNSGPLVFVRVQHEIFSNGDLAVVEEESIVYRGTATASPNVAADPGPGQPQGDVLSTDESRYPTNEVLLFRISALTFNGHRIHYDNDYARNEEGYPNRLVHGPLLALLMLEHLHRKRPPSSLRHFAYRAVSPVFCGEQVAITDTPDGEAGRLRVVARNRNGADAVVGSAAYAD